ncbi:uncharacterized OB-fold protein [Jatrophihabitans sp. GAS493]|uniref:Zn-ribbon domain-containing OB-fold protein n=1 Tax=Jatrophihabitans sp. GAS493 TaxID=1907575 RepID=UPI000BB8BC3D|nr:OB-fold domain-containing protein [Jatrophihabitans sp. GAS493]SOD74063.1 uncharacterized OB-fold protein [Jatrophihabitans sp. GAS493]
MTGIVTSEAAVEQIRVSERLEFPYVRSLGPVVGAFADALMEMRLLGARTDDGRVLVPPTEWDPVDGEPLSGELVEVGPTATVESWTWVAQPQSVHLLERPFAFAQLRPEGATTTIVHLVDVGSPERMSTGMRVSPQWKDQRIGRIDDIAYWVPA